VFACDVIVPADDVVTSR